MSNPKTIYSQSEARRLRAHPCPDCGKMSRIDRQPMSELDDSVDPDVSVLWYCPNNTCSGHDGFSIEER